jgi:hypothetical protein
MLLTREAQAVLRADMHAVARQLPSNPQIADPSAAGLIADATAAMAQGPHPERGTTFGLATFGHAAIVFVAAAVVGAFAGQFGPLAATATLAGGLVLKESKELAASARVLGTGIDGLIVTARDQVGSARAQAVARLRLLVPFRDFVALNADPLLRIAENSPRMRWLRRYVTYVVRANGAGIPPPSS